MKHNFLLVTSAAVMIFAGVAIAQDQEIAPPSYEAAPDIYQIIAENEKWRVVRSTWQPGQEDEMHSHGPDRISISLTDCSMVFTDADFNQRQVNPKAGSVRLRTDAPIAAHTAQNVSDHTCVTLTIEPK